MNRKLIPYAMSFESFLLSSLEESDQENIREIILYGSSARGDFRKDSDVDIFINVYKPASIEKKVDRIVEDFYKTEIFKKWKLLGIENTFSCIVDNIEKWKDLKISILSNGIILFSKYTVRTEGKQFVIFYWDKITSESKRVHISQKLYGYKTKKAIYKGLLDQTNSIKIGSNCIFVPLENANKISNVFKENKITVKMIYVSKVE